MWKEQALRPAPPTSSIYLGPGPAQGSLLSVSVELSSGGTGQAHDFRGNTLSRACLVGGISTPGEDSDLRGPSGPEGTVPGRL